MKLRWQVHPGTGPYLLLVHGFLTGPAQWLPNVAALGSCCRPVTVSLWGHAGAPSPDDADAYLPASYVAAFEDLRGELSVKRWFVLGYSLGAGLTIRYALAHPERVVGHVFTNSTSAMADDAQQQAWRDSAASAAAGIRSGGQAAMERIPVHPCHARRLPANVYAALLTDAALHDPAGIAGTLEHTNPHVSVRACVTANVRPALLLCGTRERRFRAHRDYLAAAMPHLDIVDVDAGHGVSMEAPEVFNPALATFLRECPTS